MQGLPSGGYNTGIVVPLIVASASTKPTFWHHYKCGDPAYLNQDGEIFCRNFVKCQNAFSLSNAKFKCETDSSLQQTDIAGTQNEIEVKHLIFNSYNNFQEFAMAMAIGMQSAELNLGDNQLVKFLTTLNSLMFRRWSI